MTTAAEGNTAGKGPAVDAGGMPVIDPTANVRALVEAGLRRQDDLREMDAKHVREVLSLRSEYDDKLRRAESNRIDAVRLVDVGAAGLAAQVSTQQAAALAQQTTVLSDTLRTQVATVAQAAQASLVGALAPMQKAIDDLRQAQYQQQGQAVQRTEGKGTSQWVVTTVVGAAAVVLSYFAAHLK